jgi:hypothetical protein
MLQVRLVRFDLGDAREIGGLVRRRNGLTVLIVDVTATTRDVIGLARELLTEAEMGALRSGKVDDRGGVGRAA